MRFVRLASFLGGALTCALFASQAAAQDRSGFALNRFDPADRGSEWFMADTLDLRGHVRPALGIVGDWAHKPLVVYNPDDTEHAAIVQESVLIHPGGSIVLWDRVRGAFDLPIALYQTGDGPTLNGVRYTQPGTAVGDLRLSADLRLLGSYGDVFNSAIGFALYLPTGSRDDYTGDGNIRFAPRATVAGDIAMFTYSARVAFEYRPLTERYDTNPLGSDLALAAAAGLRVVDKRLVVGPELYGSTVTNEGSFFEKRTSPLEWLIGAHYTQDELRVGGGIGSGLTRGWGTPTLRMVATVEWAPGADKDTDGDGIFDREDACPNVKGIRTNDPKTNGCPPPPPPPPPADRDGDGIPDYVDACPDVPGVESQDPQKNGCPPDRDGDGIYDKDDACPDVPGVKSDDPAKNGCPPDRDGDGIPDDVDACPDVKGVKSDDPKKNGCPPDRDGDGIPDDVDACPDVPGPADPDPQKNGCPLARVEGNQIKITQQVQFKTNSAEILRDSDPLLTAVATIIKDHPELQKIRVEGHTDNRGPAGYNKQLSERRAASVVKWLTTFGVDKKRLVGKGWGLERPIESNDTEEGRQANRRVEFHIEEVPAPKPPATPPGKK